MLYWIVSELIWNTLLSNKTLYSKILSILYMSWTQIFLFSLFIFKEVKARIFISDSVLSLLPTKDDKTYPFILSVDIGLMGTNVFSFYRINIDLYLKCKTYFQSDRNENVFIFILFSVVIFKGINLFEIH